MKSATLIVQLYRWVAQAFPETFFRAHGDDLVFASEEMIQETAAREGIRGLVGMASRLMLDLLRSISVEYASEIRQDLSYAIRNLRHQKIAAITAIVSLSFGISTVTVSYSQLESTMLRSVPEVRDPDRIVVVQSSISYPDYERLRDGSHRQLESTAAYLTRVPVMLRIAGSPERIFGHIVSENYFSTLGASASFGRLLGNEDGKGAAPSIVISHWLWREKFGANPQAIGQRVHVNGQPVTIVGVTSKDFRGASPMTAVADIFLPVRIGSKVMPELGNDLLEKRIASFTLIGRLAPGVESTQAEAALDTQMRTIEKEANDPGKDRPGRRITLMPGGKVFPVRKEDLAMFTGMPLASDGADALDRLRQCGDYDSGQSAGASEGDRDSSFTWSQPGAADPSASDGKHSSFCDRRSPGDWLGIFADWRVRCIQANHAWLFLLSDHSELAGAVADSGCECSDRNLCRFDSGS